MTATDAFFNWFYTGLNGLGGWFIFFLIALAAVVWLFYNSSSRRLPALGWRLGAPLTAGLLLPAMLFQFSSLETRAELLSFIEWIFYLGLLGGIIPPVLAVGYYVSYQGMVGCREGHTYEAAFGECPECARQRAFSAPQPVYMPFPQPATPISAPPVGPPMPPKKPKAQAWLVSDSSGRSYQLNAGDTTIGRGGSNDIQLTDDRTVSRDHVRIVMEANGRFKLIDLGSTKGTRLNGRLMRSPELLEADDEIQLGDNTKLRFITGRR